jgi:hypothetical protein
MYDVSDDFKHFFQKYGPVVDHQIMRDHQTKRSRGFGFIVFSSDQVVDDLLANGNMIDLAGAKVSLVHFITQMLSVFLWCNATCVTIVNLSAKRSCIFLLKLTAVLLL